MKALKTLSLLFLLASPTQAGVQEISMQDDQLPTHKFPVELSRIQNEVQRMAQGSTLNLKFIEYVYYLNQGAQRYSADVVNFNKERLKKSLGAEFEDLISNEKNILRYEKFLQRRLALYPELHIRQAMSRASAPQVVNENDFANCADYGKAFVQVGLNQGLSRKNFKVIIFAEKKSFEKVCTAHQKPLLDPRNLSGVYFSFTYTIAYLSKENWYLINPEATTAEVFDVGKSLPPRGQIFRFPFLSQQGASDFLVAGVFDLDSFLKGYDIAEPINLSISGDAKNRNLCLP